MKNIYLKKSYFIALLYLIVFRSVLIQGYLDSQKQQQPKAVKTEEIKDQIKAKESLNTNKDKLAAQRDEKVPAKKKKKKTMFKRISRAVKSFFVYNFHTVERDKCYRSRQLSTNALKKYIKRYSIKTILNLRGQKEQKTWWKAEQALAKEFDVNFVSVQLKADEMPTKEAVLTILSIFDNYEKPILIHCRRGADRTGLAAALWILEKMGKDKAYAKKQLSIWYGHYSYFTPKMLKFIEMYKGREWLKNEYKE